MNNMPTSDTMLWIMAILFVIWFAVCFDWGKIRRLIDFVKGKK
jgi:hypothetical protein